MTDAPQSDPSHAPDPAHEDSYGPALGRLASGLFIVTTRDERGQPMGFLGSFVQQVSLDPPTVMVAVAKGREHLDAIRAAGRFGVSVLGEEDKGLMKPFFKKPEDGSPFDDVAHASAPDGASGPGSPVLADALAWLDCRVAGEHNAGDHVVVFGVVESGARSREGEPLTHSRKNGLRYA